MGFAEPPEHWAPPESLDLTPVWKQYLLVALIVLAFVGIAGAYAFAAVAPDVVTPPALVLGSRVVLAVSEHPPGTTKRVDVGGTERAFFLVNVGVEQLAIRATWTTERAGGQTCSVNVASAAAPARALFVDACTSSFFDAAGHLLDGPARRDLDRYLVSRRGDRFVVSLDRLIEGRYVR